MDKINRFVSYLKSISIYKYFIFGFIIQLIPNIIIGYFFISENTNTTVNLIESLNNTFLTFLFTVILGPLFETLLFQVLIVNFIKAMLGNRKTSSFFSIIISGFLFGSVHYYNISYLLYGIVSGIIFASIYYFSQFVRKENGFLIVFLVHLGTNLLAFLTNALN